MPIAVLSLIVAGLLGYGAAAELVVRGILDGQSQPTVACTATAATSFHLYGVLPPHHNAGFVALALAIAASL